MWEEERKDRYKGGHLEISTRATGFGMLKSRRCDAQLDGDGVFGGRSANAHRDRHHTTPMQPPIYAGSKPAQFYQHREKIENRLSYTPFIS